MTYLLPGHIDWCISLFLNYLDNLNKTGKIKFTTEISDQQKGLESPDLRVKCSLTYLKPSTCYQCKNIKNLPHGIALQITRMCDIEERFEFCTNEYKQYLIAQDYKPSKKTNSFKKFKK